MGGLHIYRNTRTGVFFETPCECAGDDWEEVNSSSPAPTDPESGRKPTPKKTTRKGR